MSSSAIGLKIRQRRKQGKITQASLAKDIGISASYLNLIEANKRAVGGSLLTRIAQILNMDVDELSGVHERRISDDLREIPSEPLLHHLALNTNEADAVVAQHPDWARAILTLYRAYLDNGQMITALSDRLSKDPLLQDSVHQMLTHITTIRSTAEILDEEDDLEREETNRFYTTLNSESLQLSEVAQQLVSFLDQQHTGKESLSPAEEVDEFIIGQRNWFPGLEQEAEALLVELSGLKRHNLEGALEEFLDSKLGFVIRTAISTPDQSEFRQRGITMDRDNRVLLITPGLELSTLRFELARVIATESCADTITSMTNDARLSSAEARERAHGALTSYIAASIMMPYNSFIDDARVMRYDVERLSREYRVSYEQVCHRLVSLRNPNNEGIPLAMLRADPSGHITKRFPLYGFPLPRFGHGCPLWSVFSALQQPNAIVRQLVEFPTGGKFMMFAKAVSKPASRFHHQPVRYALLLACDLIHADKTIYAEGMDLSATGIFDPVGPGCRLCNRDACLHRQEAHVVGRTIQ